MYPILEMGKELNPEGREREVAGKQSGSGSTCFALHWVV